MRPAKNGGTRMTRKLVLLVLGGAITVAGCFAHAVGMGNRFEWEQVDRLKIGMSQDEVIQIMGSKPTAVNATAEGGRNREELGWVDLGAFSYKSVGAIFVDGKLAEIKRTTGP